MKESNTTAAKEMAAKLAQMKAEREKQDTMWQQPTYTSAAETHPYQASSSRTNQRGTS